MKRIVAIFMVIIFPFTLSAQDLTKNERTEEGEEGERKAGEEYGTGFIDGQQVAKDNYSSQGWFALGFAGGLLLGLIGTGIVVGISQSGTVNPPVAYHYMLDGKSANYRIGYMEGYSKEAKSKRLVPSILGGVLGSAIIVAIIVSSEQED